MAIAVKVVCEHCGLPFAARRVEPGRPAYCCSGCAFAARLVAAPGDGKADAAPLAAALGAVFFFFNQALFWLLAQLPGGVAEAGAERAYWFSLVSLAAAPAAWAAGVFFQTRSGARRVTDAWSTGVALAGLAGAIALGRPGLALIVNALFGAWSARGLVRRKRI